MSTLGDSVSILGDLSVNAIIFISGMVFLGFLIWRGSLQTQLTTIAGFEILSVYIPLGLLTYSLFIHAINQ